jgi:DNA-binding beta-propeller fold protein YncE
MELLPSHGSVTAPPGHRSAARAYSYTGTRPRPFETEIDWPERRVIFLTRIGRRNVSVVAAAIAAAAIALLNPNAAAATGELSQATGAGLCFHEGFALRTQILELGSYVEKKGFCRRAVGLQGASRIEISPDGRNAYVTATNSSTLTIFRRDPRSGRLAQLRGRSGCISPNGAIHSYNSQGLLKKRKGPKSKPCGRGRGLRGVVDAVVSADGRFVYTASYDPGNAISVFARNADTGRLTQLSGEGGCISEEGEGGCAEGHRLDDAISIVLSPDGKYLYAATYSSRAVVVMERDPATGVLTLLPGQASCISDVRRSGECSEGRALKEASDLVVSPDGRNVYVSSQESNALAVFDRDPLTGQLTQKPGAAGCFSDGGALGCAGGADVGQAIDVAISPDGKSVYVSAVEPNAVVIFDRNPANGELTPKPGAAGCVAGNSALARHSPCQRARGLISPSEIEFSPDGKNVYVASSGTAGVAIFDRDPLSGALSQKPGKAGCISSQRTKGACRTAFGLVGTGYLAISPDGSNLYVGAAFDGVSALNRRLPQPEAVATTALAHWP